MKSRKISDKGLIYTCDKKQGKIRKDLKGRISKVLISSTCINKRISTLAKQITADSRKNKIKELEAVVVLKGAAAFASKLGQEIYKSGGPAMNFNYIQASSYGTGTVSSGKVSIKGRISPVRHKPVLIVEDIIDTGLTMKKLKNHIEKDLGASSVKICSLLNKPDRRLPSLRKNFKIDYTGFDVPDVFVAGFGIDCSGKFRELPYIVAVKEKSFKNKGK
jgi:hypoxanthine phosphoribosyltransferase